MNKCDLAIHAKILVLLYTINCFLQVCLRMWFSEPSEPPGSTPWDKWMDCVLVIKIHFPVISWNGILTPGSYVSFMRFFCDMRWQCRPMIEHYSQGGDVEVRGCLSNWINRREMLKEPDLLRCNIQGCQFLVLWENFIPHRGSQSHGLQWNPCKAHLWAIVLLGVVGPFGIILFRYLLQNKTCDLLFLRMDINGRSCSLLFSTLALALLRG